MNQLAQSLYEVVVRRRDVRREFIDGPLDPEVLGRILAAAHHAPSVGMSQPWDFVVVRDRELRAAFRDHVLEERANFAASLDPERRERFDNVRIEGILEAQVGIVVTYDASRGSPNVLGRHAIADAGLYSVCLAIENLWLAATAEGIGVGWVSFYREPFLASLLGIPAGIRPVAWLAVGPVARFQEVPDLERADWQRRRPLAPFVHLDRFDADAPGEDLVVLPERLVGESADMD
ncbi:cob(II)yrinic acid a,c-diamide reductase [Acidimicrobium ferrooxidans DSM 10331]|uniref:Cob(II)yrinic acid a,c-diamide reductase n=1 Tax=Acidimicrobium ferrooxidans (strain DSM 10331 / JCM 15462 / NBRC 103882 / ICP) TaxID=525909 RepID=C7M2J6_ACIFD|nr:5,6-dimethylbenzimidazole synthase [Acidimicrobium ferrooxidans]ACU53240.1 cob(II)yrinic acid a,c-diamide reductase [Acidimicrobium ferrooxidans DSM 10331]